ncbi:17595_t:CDS:2 [Acaulospora morrowiae]|uniref:17595_t:CDS:1 n=1 Tax=Acaulospora morrowiae TaxID=94023 RepID=A0A9N8WFA0_9GLOM|nr:17595_t:CDS:2 [Acaulospora morrowiae]
MLLTEEMLFFYLISDTVDVLAIADIGTQISENNRISALFAVSFVSG